MEEERDMGRGAVVTDGIMARWVELLLSDRARPLRFAVVGGTAGVTQLALLALLERGGWPALLANAVAFLCAAQVNFLLSATFTWRDRARSVALWRRWIGFHGSIAGMAVLNMLVFATARMVWPSLVSSAIGIVAAALGNFLLGDRLVFRRRPAGRRAARDQADEADGADGADAA